MTPMLDWHGVLSGQPLQWIISGFLTTVWVSVAGILLATLLAVLLLALRLGGGRAGRGLVAAWVSLFRKEEIASGLRAVSHGQREAALSQGFTPWQELRFILLPQGLANAWQPIVGQYLNLMKLSSLASGIGFAELTYQVRQIESYNAHALEAFAVGTALYLALGVAMGVALTRLGPGRKLQRSAQHER